MTSHLARQGSPSPEPDSDRPTDPTGDEELAHQRALLEIRRAELSQAFDSTDDPLAQSAMAFELEQVKQQLAAMGPATTPPASAEPAFDEPSTPGPTDELEPIDYHEPADYRVEDGSADNGGNADSSTSGQEDATRTIDYSRAVLPMEPDAIGESDSWLSHDTEPQHEPEAPAPLESSDHPMPMAAIDHLEADGYEFDADDSDELNDDGYEFVADDDYASDGDEFDGNEFDGNEFDDDEFNADDGDELDDFDDFDDRAHAFLTAPGPVGDEANDPVGDDTAAFSDEEDPSGWTDHNDEQPGDHHHDDALQAGASMHQASVGPPNPRTRQQGHHPSRDSNGGRILVVTALFVAALAGMLWLDAGERSSEPNSATLTGLDPASSGIDQTGADDLADGDTANVDPDIVAILNRIRGVLRSLELLNVVVDYRDEAIHLIGPVPTRSDIDAAVSAARAIAGELPLDTTALIVGVPVRAEGLSSQSSDTIVQPGASSIDGPLRIGLVAPSAIDDSAFTQSMVDAVNVIAAERSVELSIADNTVAPADAALAIREFAAQGHHLVIVHGSQFGAALLDIAGDYPDTAFAWGTSSDTFGLTNVYAYHVAADEGGYVFGAMAAMLSRAAVLGVVGPIEVGDAARYIDGFTAGASAQRPGIDVRTIYTGSYGDTELAAEAAAAHIAAGADVLTGSAQMAVGALSAGQVAGVRWFANQADHSPLAADTVVASQIYRWDVVLRPIIDDVDSGRLSGTTYTATLANGGLALAFNPMVSLPPEVRQRADELIADLTDGSLVIAP